MKTLSILLATTVALAPTVQAQTAPDQTATDRIEATWFGVTNQYYRIGDAAFIQDGAVSLYSGEGVSKSEAVDRAWSVLEAGGAIPPQLFIIGHDHGDHSVDVLEWSAKFPEAPFFAPASTCATFAEAGIGERCTAFTPETADGTWEIALGENVTIRPFRWRHSSHSNCEWRTDRPDFPTFGWLMEVRTGGDPLYVFANDSGSPKSLTIALEDDDGTWRAPTQSLIAAMESFGTDRIDLWQGGSENRVLTQARYLIPTWEVGAFQPQHWADRGNVLYEGISWDWTPGPDFPAFLAQNGTAVLKQDNFFDAIVVDAGGARRLPNPEVKAAAGLPASGPGTKALVPHPKLATIPMGQCPGD